MTAAKGKANTTALSTSVAALTPYKRLTTDRVFELVNRTTTQTASLKAATAKANRAAGQTAAEAAAEKAAGEKAAAEKAAAGKAAAEKAAAGTAVADNPAPQQSPAQPKASAKPRCPVPPGCSIQTRRASDRSWTDSGMAGVMRSSDASCPCGTGSPVGT